MKHCKIVFMGTPNIAMHILQRLLDDEYQVIGVVTQPDKKVGRKQELQMSSVKKLALTYKIPVFQPYKIREDYESLMELPMDLIVTCAYGQFIPQEVLDKPTYGSINVHASLLPKLRGGAPIHKAIMYGEKETGMSIMRMVPKMDAGAVMAQARIAIANEDTAGTLFDKLTSIGADLLSQSIPQIISGDARFIEQEEAQATFAYTITKEEEYIDFDQDVQAVYNHIRGLLPNPTGHATVMGKKVKFHSARVLHDECAHTPGNILGLVDQGFAIETRNGLILVDEIQMEGKAKCDAKAFYNGVGKQLMNKKFEGIDK